MPIVELKLGELERGTLAEAFSGGAGAVLLRHDRVIGGLWKGLMGNPGERLPWEVPLAEVARNHHGSGDITDSLGDVIYFRPGHHGHIARKLEITRAPADGGMTTRPEGFHQDGQWVTPSATTLSDCWALAATIMAAMTPEDATLPPFKVAVQRLKYQHSMAALEALTALVGNSLGGWGRIGFALDSARARAAGPFAVKGLAHLFGLLSLVPLISGAVERANAALARRDQVGVLGRDEHLIEKPHYDTRYFSAICGTRDTVRTQIHAGGRWIDLPIAPDTVAIVPGKLARQRLGLPATLHRVVHCEPVQGSEGRSVRDGNTTLLIGAK